MKKSKELGKAFPEYFSEGRFYPKEWEPTKVHIKSGWKNNPNILSEIVTAINDEIYVEDEHEMMEKIDVVLEYLKSKYKIEQK